MKEKKKRKKKYFVVLLQNAFGIIILFNPVWLVFDQNLYYLLLFKATLIKCYNLELKHEETYF